MQSLNETVVPIRKAMSEVNNDITDLKINKDAQIGSVPIQLLTLISLLIDGIEMSNQGFSKASFTASQIIMYNFRNHNSNRDTRYRRHLRSRETPFPLHTSMNLYS